MNKKLLILAISATIIALPALAAAQPTTDNSLSSAAPAAKPSVGDSSSSAAPTAPPAGNSSSSAAPVTPPAGNSSSSAAPSTPPTGGSSSSAAPASTPSPVPPTPPSSGGGSTSSSGSFIGGGFSAVPLAIRTATSTATASADCPLITAYMKLGWNNPADQVAKLQAFLKNSEHLNVSVTGIFDQQTEQAVEAFQRKYLETIMGPWSATKPSGTVYITTIKKINEIACNQPLTLDPKELSTIAQYVKNLASGARNETAQTIEVGAVSSSTTVSGPVVPIGPALIGQNVTASSSNAAAVGNASVIQRFWSFIKSIF